MRNDRMLSNMGIAPIVVAGVSAVLPKIIPSFGPSAEFQERQQYRDHIVDITRQIEAMLPAMPEYLQPIVKADLAELGRRVWREGMRADDYRAALSWFEGRTQAWQMIQPPKPEPVAPATAVTVKPATTLLKGKVVTDVSTGKAVLVPGGTPTTTVTDPTTGQTFEVATSQVQPAAMPAVQEAGFPWWIAAALLGGLFLFKK